MVHACGVCAFQTWGDCRTCLVRYGCLCRSPHQHAFRFHYLLHRFLDHRLLPSTYRAATCPVPRPPSANSPSLPLCLLPISFGNDKMTVARKHLFAGLSFPQNDIQASQSYNAFPLSSYRRAERMRESRNLLVVVVDLSTSGMVSIRIRCNSDDLISSDSIRFGGLFQLSVCVRAVLPSCFSFILPSATVDPLAYLN